MLTPSQTGEKILVRPNLDLRVENYAEAGDW